MTSDEIPVWGIHMGRPGGHPHDESRELTRRLQREEYIALGWPCMGDLSTLPPDRDAFKERFLVTCFEPPTARSLAQQVGNLFRFVHVLRVGDLVVSPTPGGGPINIGRIVGNYEYRGGDGHDYHHRRKVAWLISTTRDQLSEASKDALTVQMSLFRVFGAADEYRQLAGEAPIQIGS